MTKDNETGQNIIKKAASAGVLCLMLLYALMCIGCGQGSAYKITITAPGGSNGVVTPGHGFFVTGVIKGERVIPDDAVLSVSVMDGNRTEVRFAESTRKNEDRIDRFCDAFFYYADDTDPKRSTVQAKEFPFLIVDGSGHSLQKEAMSSLFTVSTKTGLALTAQKRALP